MLCSVTFAFYAEKKPLLWYHRSSYAKEFIMRLDKFLVEMGIGSRSQVKQYVKKGAITINGVPARSSDIKIDENNDTIIYNGKALNYSRYRYFLLNKPAGCVSATSDNLHRTVLDLLEGENTRDLAPVGRLDIDTEGLLLITNDGALSHRLLSPAHHVPKTYYAEIDGYVTDETAAHFRCGVDIGDDKKTLPANLEILSADMETCRSTVELTITEGRFHQVKRMFQAEGMSVTYLRRISMGALRLDESLATGHYRALTDDEISSLQTTGTVK